MVQLALRTDGPRLFWTIEVPRVHTDSLSISLSRLIAALPPAPGRADTTNPFGSSFNAAEETGSICYGRSMNRANLVLRETLTGVCLHRFASLLAPVFFTKTMDGTTQHQLLADRATC
ncbi:hypothetical protein INS49_005998 [Diaporthe citri]|uniref:uncharacterized protein n=1 Tax=Diaporthe citri TaxID=83186 RepID=UPI001C812671|nr:uncharacterized protein INS49_005998 [Diaporthe citri]KAG6364397.1 hypothetical protein INS49_005998 [Diaporthe citri]